MKCKRCGRALKNQKSIANGFGSSCAKKEGIVKQKTIRASVKKCISLGEFI